MVCYLCAFLQVMSTGYVGSRLVILKTKEGTPELLIKSTRRNKADNTRKIAIETIQYVD